MTPGPLSETVAYLLLGDGFSIALKPDIFRRKQLVRRNLQITNEIVSNRICADEQ